MSCVKKTPLFKSNTPTPRIFSPRLPVPTFSKNQVSFKFPLKRVMLANPRSGSASTRATHAALGSGCVFRSLAQFFASFSLRNACAMSVWPATSIVMYFPTGTVLDCARSGPRDTGRDQLMFTASSSGCAAMRFTSNAPGHS